MMICTDGRYTLSNMVDWRTRWKVYLTTSHSRIIIWEPFLIPDSLGPGFRVAPARGSLHSSVRPRRRQLNTTEVQQFTCMCKHAECLWTGTKSVVRQTKRMRRHKYEGDLELVDNIIGWPFFGRLLDRRNDSLGEMLHYNGKKEQVGVFVFHHFPLLFLLFIIIFWDRIFQYTSKLG